MSIVSWSLEDWSDCGHSRVNISLVFRFVDVSRGVTVRKLKDAKLLGVIETGASTADHLPYPSFNSDTT